MFQGYQTQVPGIISLFIDGKGPFNISASGWFWSDNNPTGYTNWAPDEPNNDNEDEECVEMIPETGGWNDNNCVATRPFVCKTLKSRLINVMLRAKKGPSR